MSRVASRLTGPVLLELPSELALDPVTLASTGLLSHLADLKRTWAFDSLGAASIPLVCPACRKREALDIEVGNWQRNLLAAEPASIHLDW